MKAFSDAQFLASAGGPADMPPPGPPEIVFAGRSNVGKSSAINALTGRKRLAFTSKTPGRTQTINFYALGAGARLVDLPGYGYAKVPQAVRAQWRTLVGVVPRLARHARRRGARRWTRGIPFRRLTSSSSVFWVRHGCSRCSPRPTSSRAPSKQRRLRSVRASLRAEVRLFSSLTRQGVDECRDLLEQWLQSRPRK